MMFPHFVRDLPEKPYYLIFTERSITIPGDERSQTNPGHGYPESTEYSLAMTAYEDEEKWEKEIINLATRQVKFQAIRANPAKVATTITVKVS